MQCPDFLSNSPDRNFVSSLFLSDQRVSFVNLLVKFLSQVLATALTTVLDLSLSDLFLCDLNSALESLSLEVSDMSLAFCLGDKRFGCEQLLLPFEFFFLVVLSLLLVKLDLDIQSLGNSLCQGSGNWAQLLFVRLLVMMVVVHLVVVMDSMMVMNLVMMHNSGMSVMIPVMVDMMMVFVVMTSMVGVNLKGSVMVRVGSSMMAMMVYSMVVMNLVVVTTVVNLVMVSTAVSMVMPCLMMMSAWASVLVASVEFTIVFLETFHQASLVNMVLMSMLNPLVDFFETTMVGSSLSDNEVRCTLG